MMQERVRATPSRQDRRREAGLRAERRTSSTSAASRPRLLVTVHCNPVSRAEQHTDTLHLVVAEVLFTRVAYDELAGEAGRRLGGHDLELLAAGQLLPLV